MSRKSLRFDTARRYLSKDTHTHTRTRDLYVTNNYRNYYYNIIYEYYKDVCYWFRKTNNWSSIFLFIIASTARTPYLWSYIEIYHIYIWPGHHRPRYILCIIITICSIDYCCNYYCYWLTVRTYQCVWKYVLFSNKNYYVEPSVIKTLFDLIRTVKKKNNTYSSEFAPSHKTTPF